MNSLDSIGNTPLHICVEDDSFDAMDYLLSMYVQKFNIAFLTDIQLNGTIYLLSIVMRTKQWRQCEHIE